MVFENAINRLGFVGRVVFILFFYIPFRTEAQVNEVYIFPGASLYAHPNSNINIFSDLSHNGTFLSYATARIDFFGASWANGTNSRLPDDSSTGLDGIGGVFRFSGRFLPGQSQTIVTAGSQPYHGFPNLSIDNLNHVSAVSGNLYINHTLDFLNGNLILTDVDVSVGRNGGGSITGYGNTRFIVTGIAETGGSLIRTYTGTSTDPTHYPVGATIASYTPASVVYHGKPQNIKLRVFEEVYNKPEFSEYVRKTWAVAREFTDESATLDLTLQHNSEDEGINYTINRNDAYISRYDANLVGLYDIVASQSSPTPGLITTNPAGVIGAYMNTRLNIGALKATEYFTKSVIKKQVDENTPKNIPDAISPNGDGLNDTYIIEKRLATDKVRFEVYSRNQVLVYQHLDYDNSFDGTGNRGGFMGNVLPDGIYYYLISVNGAKGIPGYLVINR